MASNKQIIHDLALVHAQAKYAISHKEEGPYSGNLQEDIGELIGFYTDAVTWLVNRADEIDEAYSDDDGKPIFSFE